LRMRQASASFSTSTAGPLSGSPPCGCSACFGDRVIHTRFPSRATGFPESRLPTPQRRSSLPRSPFIGTESGSITWGYPSSDRNTKRAGDALGTHGQFLHVAESLAW